MQHKAASDWKKYFFPTALFACFFCLVATAVLGYRYQVEYDISEIEAQAKYQAINKVNNAIGEINAEFNQLKKIVDTVVKELTDVRPDQLKLKRILEKHYYDNSDFLLKQIGVAYREYAYDASVRLFSPGYTKDESGKLVFRDSPYDYTLPDSPAIRTSWYHLPLANGKQWMEPYWGTGAKDYLAEYISPFYGSHAQQQQRQKIGVVYANYSLDKVRNRVNNLDLGAKGYAFIVSKGKRIVSHSIKSYVNRSYEALDDKVLNKVVTFATTSGINYVSETTGQAYWLLYLPIEKTDWHLGVVLNESDFLPHADQKRRDTIWLMIASMGFLLFLGVVVFRLDLGTTRSAVGYAVFAASICFLGLVFVWNFAVNSEFASTLHDGGVYNDSVNPSIKVFNAAENQAVLDRCMDLNPAIQQVKTGVFVQSLKFLSANNVLMTGYVWQKHPSVSAQKIIPPVIFPEAEESSLVQAFEQEENGQTLVGWYFSATLREVFHNDKFPFDKVDVWLRLWHSDFNRDTILVPDFAAYRITDPFTMPGLEKYLVTDGWDIEDSYFSYQKVPYNTTFGYTGHGAKNSCPELYFSVGMKRKITGPFISHLLPLWVISILLFGVLLIISKHEQKIVIFGFTVSDVLAYCATLFIVLIVSHVHLRSSLSSQGVSYLEYFYFITYILVLIVSANAILFSAGEKYRLIQYKDNLLIKVLYWPVLMASLLIISLFVFY